MKHRYSIVMSMFLLLFFLVSVMGEQGAHAASTAANKSGSLWIEVTPNQMYIGDCDGSLSYGGGVGAYRLWVHDTIKTTQVPGQNLYRFCATVGGDYAFQVWDGSGNTVSARVKVLPRSDQPPPTKELSRSDPQPSTKVLPRSDQPPPTTDMLGKAWRVIEGDPNWTGTWTRRGTSNVFDAVWNGYGQRQTGVLTMVVSGNSVTIARGNDHYTGTITGKSVSGTASWYRSGQRWSATIE